MDAMTDEAMGPIDYLLVEWPGRRLDGEVAPYLVDLVDRGLIRILDLAGSSPAAESPSSSCRPRSKRPRLPEESLMPGLLRGIGRTAMIAGTASAVSGRVQRRRQRRWAEQEASAETPSGVGSPVAGGVPAEGTSLLEQLKQIGELRDSGVLVQDEFAAQKAKLPAG